MNKKTSTVLLTAALCIAGVACEKKEETPRKYDSNGVSTGTPKAPPAADNTARNKVDRDPSQTQTPIDQSETSEDVKITAEIRRAVMKAEPAMSINAQNCKIITEKGAVTLRGPVASQGERDTIGTYAKNTAGVLSVDNQLEVKTP